MWNRRNIMTAVAALPFAGLIGIRPAVAKVPVRPYRKPVVYPIKSTLDAVHWHRASDGNSLLSFHVQHMLLPEHWVFTLECDDSKFGSDPASLFLLDLDPNNQPVTITESAWEFPDEGVIVETLNDPAFEGFGLSPGLHRIPKFMQESANA